MTAEHHTQDAELLDRLEKLARDATPGEWHVTKYCSVMDEGMETLVVSSDSSHEDRAFIAAANPAALLKLIAMARRSIPQGDEPAKARSEESDSNVQKVHIAAAQGDDLLPLPWDDSEANRANKITVRVGDLSDAMREYGAACRAGRAKGEDAEAIIAFGASLLGFASETDGLDEQEARAWVRARWLSAFPSGVKGEDARDAS